VSFLSPSFRFTGLTDVDPTGTVGSSRSARLSPLSPQYRTLDPDFRPWCPWSRREHLLSESIFFFADVAAMASQNASTGDDEGFGPVQGAEQTKFRVTSLHKGTASTAYAVCKGRVRVQKDNRDSALLTLVLAPDAELLRGIPIRYFVYRGIRKDSLIDGQDKLIPGTLTNRLLADTDPSNNHPDALGLAFRRAVENPEAPEFARENADPIESIFFETTTLKAIVVQAGDALGLFNDAGFGFEIMVGSAWEAPTLDVLRNVAMPPGNIVEIPANTPAALERALREKVYAYLDPCAFYGMCFDRTVKYKTGSSAAQASADGAQQIHDLLLAKFHNRNTVYLDVRNENGLSYNYYDIYGFGEIVLGLDNSLLQLKKSENIALDTSQPKPYATHGWPLKIIPGPSLLNIAPNDKKAGIRLALSTGEPLSDKVQRRIFFDFARLYYDSKGKKNGSKLFRKSNDPRLFEPAGDGRIPIVTRDTWSHDVVLGLPAVTVGTVRRPIAFYSCLRYLRQHEARPTGATRYVNTAGQWDNLFALQSAPTRWKNDNLSSWWLTGHVKFLEPQLGNQQVYKGVAETGVAVDRDPVTMDNARYTFYYVPVYVAPEPATYRVTSGGNPAGTGGAVGATNSFFQRKESGQLYDGSGKLKLLKFSEFKGNGPPSNPSSYLTFLSVVENPKEAANNSRESLCAMSFSAAEYGRLLTHAASTKSDGTTPVFDARLHPIFLQARGKLHPRDSEKGTERAYQALELRLVGLDPAGQYASVDIPSSGPGSVTPLSLSTDGLIFCTHEAAQFEPLPIKWDYKTICTQVRPGTLTDDEHRADIEYFQRAIADIKNYYPQFYGRMERLQLLGAAVILHDSPGVTQRQPYPIEVSFGTPATGSSGETIADQYYQATFPGQGTPTTSNAGLRMFNLSTVPLSASAHNRYNELNVTRYVDLNRRRRGAEAINQILNSSQVNELFLTDYTRAEITADPNTFDKDKLYLESDWSPTGSGPSPGFQRITLAELKNLGFGSLRPGAAVRITINRAEAYREVEIYEYADSNTTFSVKAYNPLRQFVSTTLIHELAHAEMAIREPLISLLWSRLEGIFNHSVDSIEHPITGATHTTPVVITCIAHGFTTGERIRVEDVGGNTAANGFWTITEGMDPDHFSLNGSIGTQAYTQGGVATVSIVANRAYEFKDIRLTAVYPNPALISTRLQAFDTQLKTEGFLARTGSGHLRGSPNAQNACLVERVFKYALNRVINKWIVAAIPLKRNPHTQREEPSVSFTGNIVFDVDVSYCFLNFEDSDLNPGLIADS
jgi:hypothetical protein